MIILKPFLLFALITCSLAAYAQATSDTLTNKSIIQLQKIGLSKELIQAKIRSATTKFDLSTDGLILLKKSGVPDDVVMTMFEKGNASATHDSAVKTGSGMKEIKALTPGLYYFNSATAAYTEIEPSVLTNMKSGGLGEALKRSMVSGLINAKTRASLSGSEAVLKITSSTTFIFVFDTSTKQGLNNNNTYFSSAQSPNEFFMVRMVVVKNNREIVVSKANVVSSNTGIDDISKIPFTFKKIQNGIYEVTPQSALTSGEYCFMFAASSINYGMTHKVYDFSVK